MTRTSLSFFGVALLAGAASAQNYFSAPPGYLTTEGGAGTTAFSPFYDATSRAQWVYGGLRGNVYPAINRLEQRRDAGTYGAGTYPARTLDLSVTLADADMAALSTTFAANYIGTPTLVYTKKTISLPDRSAAAATTPAPWDVSVPFDTNYVYLGQRDLLVEFTIDNNSAGSTGYATDTITVSSSSPGTGTSDYVDTAGACMTPNGKFDVFKINPTTDSLQSCKIANYALRGPSSAAGVWALGLTDPNLAGLFCKSLRTSVEVTLPITTDAAGAIGSSGTPISITFPLPGALSIYTQFAALDPSQAGVKLALSDAVKNNCVPYSTSTLPLGSYLYNFTTGSSAPTGTRYSSYIAIQRFRY